MRRIQSIYMLPLIDHKRTNANWCEHLNRITTTIEDNTVGQDSNQTIEIKLRQNRSDITNDKFPNPQYQQLTWHQTRSQLEADLYQSTY